MRPTPIAALLLLAGCFMTSRAVAPGVKLRPETRLQCAGWCGEMGMRLGAVVLIQGSAGCVCEPADVGRGAAEGSAAAASAVVVEQHRREQEQRRGVEELLRESSPPVMPPPPP
jgi:hypothetical protein